MAGPIKTQFPALLPDGFHVKTLAELRKLCVTDISGSITRRAIMDCLTQLVRTLTAADVEGELWIDGSFLTKKIDPDDADVLLRVKSTVYDGDANKRAAADWATDPDRYLDHSCDSYLWVEYTKGHSGYARSEDDRRYWTGWYGGHHPGYTIKGIVVLRLPAESK